MRKTQPYFPHYANARRDPKIRRIIKDHGLQAYAIYFMFLETLREETQHKYPISDLDLLAEEYKCDTQTLRAIITKYRLFEVGKTHIKSKNLIKYLEPLEQKTQRARDAAHTRWGSWTPEKMREYFKKEVESAGVEAQHLIEYKKLCAYILDEKQFSTDYANLMRFRGLISYQEFVILKQKGAELQKLKYYILGASNGKYQGKNLFIVIKSWFEREINFGNSKRFQVS